MKKFLGWLEDPNPLVRFNKYMIVFIFVTVACKLPIWIWRALH